MKESIAKRTNRAIAITAAPAEMPAKNPKNADTAAMMKNNTAQYNILVSFEVSCAVMLSPDALISNLRRVYFHDAEK